jgi:hypothetical protein
VPDSFPAVHHCTFLLHVMLCRASSCSTSAAAAAPKRWV